MTAWKNERVAALLFTGVLCSVHCSLYTLSEIYRLKFTSLKKMPHLGMLQCHQTHETHHTGVHLHYRSNDWSL